MPLQKNPVPPRPAGRPRGLAERTAVIRLCDAYAALLTAHQQQLLRLYYQEDLSLGEIAGGLCVTRQAVSDGLRRAVGEMRRLEGRLGVLAASDRNGRGRQAERRAVPVAGPRRATDLDAAGMRRPPGRHPANAARRVTAAAARFHRVEREAARLTRAGAATGPLLRALRALRTAMPVS
jgi:predicted DNA-binding protein YlxM (UPF0122 family)